MTAWEEAVKAVELAVRHEHACEYTIWLRDRDRVGIDPPCSCRRAERVAVRIAKGIERVVIACVPEPWPSALQLSIALKAFKEESA